mmetsp:Transcript_75052/g.190377  ORF Transcript_75052/g.190377 Transcript_75052/m.190377 type:complete len:308 (+) Transcript_75052:88-1011(+)
MAAFGAPMMQTAPLYSPAAAGGGGMQEYSYGGQLPGGEQAYGQTPYPVGDACPGTFSVRPACTLHGQPGWCLSWRGGRRLRCRCWRPTPRRGGCPAGRGAGLRPAGRRRLWRWRIWWRWWWRRWLWRRRRPGRLRPRRRLRPGPRGRWRRLRRLRLQWRRSRRRGDGRRLRHGPSRSPGHLDRPRAPAAAAAGPRCRWRRPGAGLRRLRLLASLGARHRRAGQPAGCRRPPGGGAAAVAAAAEVAAGPGKPGMATARDGRPRPLPPQMPRRRSRRRSGGNPSRRRHLRDAPHRTAVAPILAPALQLP